SGRRSSSASLMVTTFKVTSTTASIGYTLGDGSGTLHHRGACPAGRFQYPEHPQLPDARPAAPAHGGEPGGLVRRGSPVPPAPDRSPAGTGLLAGGHRPPVPGVGEGPEPGRPPRLRPGPGRAVERGCPREAHPRRPGRPLRRRRPQPPPAPRRARAAGARRGRL